MEIILMFVAGAIVLVITVISILRGVTHRIKSPTNDLKVEISTLKKRVNELENKFDKT